MLLFRHPLNRPHFPFEARTILLHVVRCAMANDPAFPRSSTLQVAGKRVKVWTNGSGPALLLLHSAWGDAELSWSGVWNDLSKTFFVIAPDMPGFGASESPSQPSLAAIAGILKDMLDAHSIERAIVAGNSFGAAVAIEFASIFPEYTRHLVLVNGTNLPTIPRFMKKLIGLSVLEDRFRKVIRNATYSDKAFEKAFPDPAALPQGFFDVIRRNEEQHARTVFNAFMTQAAPQAKPSGPATIIWGTGDRLVPDKQRDGCRRWLGEPNLVLIEGAGHMPQVERPGAFVKALQAVGGG